MESDMSAGNTSRSVFGRSIHIGAALTLLGLVFTAPLFANDANDASAPADREGRHIKVDDFEMWVEERGEGPPLLMLNGGFGMTSMIDPLIDAYSQHFRVIAFDARGHGRSTFGDGPITYARQAADAVELMDKLGLEKAHIFGHSDGGCASLHLLFDYPHRILSSTLSGTPYSQSNYNEMASTFVKEFPQALARLEPDPFGFLQGLRALGLRDENISKLAKRLSRAWATTPNFTLEMLAAIDRPVLVIKAGADEFIEARHFADMAAALQNGRTLDLPKMTHDPLPFAEKMAKASAAMATQVDEQDSPDD